MPRVTRRRQGRRRTGSPRVIIAGVSGDSGKTTVSLSLVAALRRRGLRVSTFKKGPDYIDAAWLANLSGAPCRNLDTHLAGPGLVRRRFIEHARGIAVVEGSRGLFDGVDADGANSTAELAKLLKAPVILVVGAAKTTRTVAAVIRGCAEFDRGLKIAGVVLNKTAGPRHERVLTAAVKRYCALPVLGVVPRQPADLIPSRHLGLVTPSEAELRGLSRRLAELAESSLDVDGILSASRKAPKLEGIRRHRRPRIRARVRVGIFRDSVFTFYYPENLEALEAEGAELVPVSSLTDRRLPRVDGLYIGGGFPETQADRLVRNAALMRSVREASKAGMPVYAECGGLIYLSRSLSWKGRRHRMAGVLPLDLRVRVRPVGHGYARLRAVRPNPFFDVGEAFRGHEFHYSGPRTPPRRGTCLRVERGVGLGGGTEGMLHKNTLGCFTHIHADSAPGWAPRFVESAAAWSAKR